MHRRHFLSLIGAAASGGCLSLGRSSTPPALGQISILNHGYEPHTVHVLVERNDQPIYWADHEAPARDDSGPGGGVLPCAWGNKAGKYAVRARLNARTKWHSINLTDYDSEVLGLSLLIGDITTGRQDTPDLTIWRTGNPNERCTKATKTTESSMM